jgi:hypothetical protein
MRLEQEQEQEQDQELKVEELCLQAWLRSVP